VAARRAPVGSGPWAVLPSGSCLGTAQEGSPGPAQTLARDHASKCACGIRFPCPGMFPGRIYFTNIDGASVFPVLSFSSLFLEEVQS